MALGPEEYTVPAGTTELTGTVSGECPLDAVSWRRSIPADQLREPVTHVRIVPEVCDDGVNWTTILPDPPPDLPGGLRRDLGEFRLEPTTPTPEPTAPATPPEAVDERPVPRGPASPTDEEPRESSIDWPEGDWELTPGDSVGVSDYIGGVAGLDVTALSVTGDGRVSLTTGREGGPGGDSSEKTGQLTPEQTKAVFTRLRDSKLLEYDEGPSGTVGSTLTVKLNGQTDRVSVASRRAEVDAVLGDARSVLP